jgi:sigma-B regulation protein RsbU (phosphoserine phosphatase)
MEGVLDNAPCGFITFTDKGAIKEVNNTLAELLGYTKKELVGKKIEMLFDIAGRIFYQTHFFPLLALHGKAGEIFFKLVKKSQEHIPVLVNARRQVNDSVGENHCVIVPVLQRKKYEEELLAAKRAAEEAIEKNVRLQEMASELEESKQELDKQISRLSTLNEGLVQFGNVISHDMQEPVHKIAMLADIVSQDDGQVLSGRSQTAIKKINRATGRLQNLINSLQEFVSVEVNNKPIMACELKNIMQAAVAKTKAEANGNDMSVQIGPLPTIEGDKHHLELLFYHIIKNAVQQKQPNTQAAITVVADIIQHNSYKATKGKYKYVDFARIQIRDSGKGFKQEYNNYVFQLFKKLDPDSPGLGFGLALCKKIVEYHSGSISVKSAVNEGTTITVMLPVKWQ